MSVACIGCEISTKMFQSEIGKMVGFCNFLFARCNFLNDTIKWAQKRDFFISQKVQSLLKCFNNQANCILFGEFKGIVQKNG